MRGISPNPRRNAALADWVCEAIEGHVCHVKWTTRSGVVQEEMVLPVRVTALSTSDTLIKLYVLKPDGRTDAAFLEEEHVVHLAKLGWCRAESSLNETSGRWVQV